MAFVRVEPRNAHRAASVRLDSVDGRAEPVAGATLTAISNSRKGNGAEEATVLQWIVWGRLAESAAQYLGKGSHVNVVGRLQNTTCEKDGETVSAMVFTAEEIDFLDTKAEGEALRARNGTPGPSTSRSALPDEEEDLTPF
jgi:single-stranded DNA-binding protein